MASDWVLFNDFQKQWETFSSKILQSVEKVGSSGWYILGQNVKSFEKNLSQMWNLGGAVGVANGTDAIEIALRAFGIKAGEKVLTTPMSAYPSTLAILRAGGEPVFVDTDKHGLIDLDLVREILSKRSDIKYFLPVHLYGFCLDLDKLEALKKDFGLKIVEDCAQSIGARWKNRGCGSVGQITATSFYPTKNLGAMGDGGAILSSDTKLLSNASFLRDYGQTEKYKHDVFGLNSRLDELHAAILNDVFLPKVPELNQKRQAIADFYLKNIKNPTVRLPQMDQSAQHSSWHLFPVWLSSSQNRTSLIEELKKNKIQSGIHYPILISDQKSLRDSFSFEIIGELKQASLLAQTELSLPVHPFLSDADLERVVSAVNAWSPK